MTQEISLTDGKKIYFASDNHLGAPSAAESLPREKKFVSWLDTIKDSAAAVFLLGDLFEFLFEIGRHAADALLTYARRD